MICKELAEKLLETPDLPVVIDAHQGVFRFVDKVLTTNDVWYHSKEQMRVIHTQL